MRLIGMLYRIPLANILGDEGNGYYSSAFTIYSILLIVSSYSLPTAVSKMIATKNASLLWNGSWRDWSGGFVVWSRFLCHPFLKHAVYQIRA